MKTFIVVSMFSRFIKILLLIQREKVFLTLNRAVTKIRNNLYARFDVVSEAISGGAP